MIDHQGFNHAPRNINRWLATLAFALSALGGLGCTVGPAQEDPSLGVIAADCRSGYGACKESCEDSYPKNETLRKECELSCKSQYCTLTCDAGYVVQDGQCVVADSGNTPDAGTSVDPVIGDAAPDAPTSDGSSTTLPSPLPTPRSGLAVVTGSDGRIYAIGGDGPSGPVATVEAYSVDTNTWTTVAPMPTPRRSLAAVLGPDGRIYAIGGTAGNGPLRTVEAYSPATNTWTTQAEMQVARTAPAAAVDGDGRIYALGGESGPPFPSSLLHVEAYSVTTNSWATAAQMAFAHHAFGAARGPDGRIYAIGGLSNIFVINRSEAYTPASGTWASVRSMPTARAALAVAPSTDGRVYALGGVAVYGSGPVATVEAYAPASNTWTTRASMPVARAGFGAALAPDGRIYVVGGIGVPQNGTNLVATVNAYVPATDTWY